jgi:hypothetical protein
MRLNVRVVFGVRKPPLGDRAGSSANAESRAEPVIAECPLATVSRNPAGQGVTSADSRRPAPSG